jgi:hypothetical protein
MFTLTQDKNKIRLDLQWQDKHVAMMLQSGINRLHAQTNAFSYCPIASSCDENFAHALTAIA